MGGKTIKTNNQLRSPTLRSLQAMLTHLTAGTSPDKYHGPSLANTQQRRLVKLCMLQQQRIEELERHLNKVSEQAIYLAGITTGMADRHDKDWIAAIAKSTLATIRPDSGVGH